MAYRIFHFSSLFQIAVFIIMLYYLILSLFGLYRKSTVITNNKHKSFALVIAAHNEETVISKIIESLKSLDYPKDKFDIFVIADNCSDRTAKIAKSCNVSVFERFDKNKRGKGYALEWMFKKIYKLNKKYDAIGIFDADNLVSKNFLKAVNNKMFEGFKVVQGYLDSKNPHDSWITEAYSISFWSANRLFQVARSNLGLSNQIGGTGFVVETELLKKIGWGATCLTEDLEFTCKLVLNGYKVGWSHDAIIYDEKPITLKQSWNQRRRWMQGFTDVAVRFFFKLIKKAIKENSFVALDCAFYVIQPFVTLLIGFSFLLTIIQNNSKSGLNIFTIECLFPLIIWKLFSLFQFLLTPLILLIEKKLSKCMFSFLCIYSFNTILFDFIFDNKDKLLTIILGHFLFILSLVIVVYLTLGKSSMKIFIWYLLYGIYTLTWIPITIQGILNKNNKEWSHTKHIRRIGISEI